MMEMEENKEKIEIDEKNCDLKGDPFVERLRSRLPREK